MEFATGLFGKWHLGHTEGRFPTDRGFAESSGQGTYVYEGGSVKVIIVGGVAGGASCAARLRRLDENAEIVMVELDVREPFELAVENVEGAVNIPLGQLRARLDELLPDKTIKVVCRLGQRAYYATRLLLLQRFDARNVSGGLLSRTYSSFFLQEGPMDWQTVL